MALSDERILDVVQPHLPEYGHAKIWDTKPQYAEAVGIEDKDARWTVQELHPEHTIAIARAIEVEVRKEDEALIRQMLEAAIAIYPHLNGLAVASDQALALLQQQIAAITAARARLAPPAP